MVLADVNRADAPVLIYDLPIRRPWPRMLATALVAALAVANGQLLLARLVRWARSK